MRKANPRMSAATWRARSASCCRTAGSRRSATYTFLCLFFGYKMWIMICMFCKAKLIMNSILGHIHGRRHKRFPCRRNLHWQGCLPWRWPQDSIPKQILVSFVYLVAIKWYKTLSIVLFKPWHKYNKKQKDIMDRDGWMNVLHDVAGLLCMENAIYSWQLASVATGEAHISIHTYCRLLL